MSTQQLNIDILFAESKIKHWELEAAQWAKMYGYKGSSAQEALIQMNQWRETWLQLVAMRGQLGASNEAKVES